MGAIITSPLSIYQKIILDPWGLKVISEARIRSGPGRNTKRFSASNLAHEWNWLKGLVHESHWMHYSSRATAAISWLNEVSDAQLLFSTLQTREISPRVYMHNIASCNRWIYPQLRTFGGPPANLLLPLVSVYAYPGLTYFYIAFPLKLGMLHRINILVCWTFAPALQQARRLCMEGLWLDRLGRSVAPLALSQW